MKSIRTQPTVHAAEGDERTRTAVPALGTDSVYDDLRGGETPAHGTNGHRATRPDPVCFDGLPAYFWFIAGFGIGWCAGSLFVMGLASGVLS